MAVAWTNITNAQVAAGAALTTALMTALRDNPEGIAQRATGAPKIFGVPYDFQEFTANGTWTKPSNAETGDRVVVHVVGGGGSGARGSGGSSELQGGQGGGGLLHVFQNIDDLGATEAVVVGAGGAAGTGNGASGGNSSFGTAGLPSSSVRQIYAEGEGGQGGVNNVVDPNALKGRVSTGQAVASWPSTSYTTPANLDFQKHLRQHGFFGGYGGGYDNAATETECSGGASIFGGGGGGACDAGTVGANGGPSTYAGYGGDATGATGVIADFAIDGEFPGGGGGSVDTGLTDDTVGGAGADGVVRVWCYREEA